MADFATVALVALAFCAGACAVLVACALAEASALEDADADESAFPLRASDRLADPAQPPHTAAGVHRPYYGTDELDELVDFDVELRGPAHADLDAHRRALDWPSSERGKLRAAEDPDAHAHAGGPVQVQDEETEEVPRM